MVACGCSRGGATPAITASSSKGAVAAADPAQKLYEQLHAGAFQFDTAIGGLNDAIAALRPLPNAVGGETKEALLNVIDSLDSAGRTLGEMTAPPDQAEVRTDVAANDKRRAKWIEDGVDAVRELREAAGTVGDLIDSQPPAKEAAALDQADSAISDALDAMEDGVKLLGGTVPPEAPEAQ